MLNLKKIENGLLWNNKEWLFTKEYLENGYEINDNVNIHVELNKHVVSFLCYDTIIDGVGPFNTSQELINEIFNMTS